MHFSVVGHLDSFHVMDIMNEAALYEHSCIGLVVDSLSFLLGKYPGVEMLITHAASLFSVNCHRSYCLHLSSPAF